MISRISLCAALFAVLATATLAFAAEKPVMGRASEALPAGVPVIVLPRVEVIGKRQR